MIGSLRWLYIRGRVVWYPVLTQHQKSASLHLFISQSLHLQNVLHFTTTKHTSAQNIHFTNKTDWSRKIMQWWDYFNVTPPSGNGESSQKDLRRSALSQWNLCSISWVHYWWRLWGGHRAASSMINTPFIEHLSHTWWQVLPMILISVANHW